MFRIKTLNSISNAIYDHLNKENFAVSPDMESPDGILVRSAKCIGMEYNKELKAIARAGAGVNNIPVDGCTETGIVVFNTPGANANAVKELVFAAMMMSSRNLLDAVSWAKTLKGKGTEVPALVEKGKNQFVGPELRGKTMGVIGLGAIGVMVANEAYAIGMNILGYDPYISVDHAWRLSRAVTRARSLEDLVKESDYISIHVPLIKDTHGYIGERLFALMKPTATLLNFSRAELVDTPAALAALKEGKFARYIVDFPTEETLGVDNVIAIPHLGASTPESEENCANMAAMQLKDFLENGNIRNSVNLPDCEMPRSGACRLCVINHNRTNMVGQITGVLAEMGANIANMLNKSRGNFAYTMIDLDEMLPAEVAARLEAIDGIIRVTVLEG